MKYEKNKWDVIKLFGKEFWTQVVWLWSLYYMTEHPKKHKIAEGPHWPVGTIAKTRFI